MNEPETPAGEQKRKRLTLPNFATLLVLLFLAWLVITGFIHGQR